MTTDRLIDTIAVSGERLSLSDGLRFPTISEAIMTAILALALTLGLGSPAPAADDKTADPVGTWKCEYEIGGQQRISTLMVKKEGDKFVGTMSWSNQKDEKIKDPKFKDGS